jgi:hypothetical protein
MSDLIDLSLLKESRTLLQRLLSKRGLAYFLARDGQRLFSLEKDKVNLVVKTAVTKLDKKGRRIHPRAVEQCKREVRRVLIQRVTEEMMRVGY